MRSTEGKGGNYTCSECTERFHRDKFLIEATCPVSGEIDPPYDWQGSLLGRCYACVRGRGPRKAEDIYADQIMRKSEEEIAKAFKRLCTQRHAQRQDIKSRDKQRLRNSYFDQLVADIGADNKSMSKSQVMKLVQQTIKDMCKGIEQTFGGDKRIG